MKKKLFLFMLMILGLNIFNFQKTFSASPFLYVTPNNISKKISENFNAFVVLNSEGNKVCAIEGEIIFNNLICNSITLNNELLAQFLPNCSKPYFLIGIPGCVIGNKNIFNLVIKGKNIGDAYIGFRNIDIISEGISIGSNFLQGQYKIIKDSLENNNLSKESRKIEVVNNQQSNVNNRFKNLIFVPKIIILEKESKLLAFISKLITLNTENNIIGLFVLIIFGILLYFVFRKYIKK